ncbi:MAG: HK97 family phage prohead protease [Paraclostridium sp.]
MNNIEQRNVNIEFRNEVNEERIIEGYASIFGDTYTLLRDRWGEKFYERIMPGAFNASLKDESREEFFLVNHDWNRAIGRTGANLELNEDEKGLRFKLKVPNTTEGNDLLENVRMGIIRGCSFGFIIEDEEVRWDDDWTFYRDVKKVNLLEVTATTHPAYADTEISEGRSSLNIKELREKEQQPIEPTEPIEPEENKNDKQESRDMLLSLISCFYN